jgi:hypothetical protein
MLLFIPSALILVNSEKVLATRVLFGDPSDDVYSISGEDWVEFMNESYEGPSTIAGYKEEFSELESTDSATKGDTPSCINIMNVSIDGSTPNTTVSIGIDGNPNDCEPVLGVMLTTCSEHDLMFKFNRSEECVWVDEEEPAPLGLKPAWMPHWECRNVTHFRMTLNDETFTLEGVFNESGVTFEFNSTYMDLEANCCFFVMLLSYSESDGQIHWDRADNCPTASPPEDEGNEPLEAIEFPMFEDPHGTLLPLLIIPLIAVVFLIFRLELNYK